MNDGKRTFLAIALIIGVVLIWNVYFTPKPAPVKATPEKEAVADGQAQGQSPEKKNIVEENVKEGKLIGSDPQAATPPEETVIESDLYSAKFTNDGAAPTSWQMKKYEGSAKGEKFVEIITPGKESAFALKIEDGNFSLPPTPRFKVLNKSSESISYVWRSADVELKKTFTFKPDDYLVDIDISIKNIRTQTLKGRIGYVLTQGLPKQEKKSFLSFAKPPVNEKKPIYYLDGTVVRKNTPVEGEKHIFKEGKILWAGIEERYFVSAIIPREQGESSWAVKAQSKTNEGQKEISTEILGPQDVIAPNEEIKHKLSLYVGPKDINKLKTIGVMLDKSIDYGMFSVIAIPILHVLKFFFKLTHNYGIAIILLTILIKILLHPISKKSMKSMKKMQQLQPQLKGLKEKYGNDKQRLNMETMQLFKQNKVNPMGGCLPIALQIPVYIALYRVFLGSIELYHSPFFWFYKDLSAPDPYYIMPVLSGVAMFLQQKMTPATTADTAQQKMMMIMPIMFTVFMLFFPAGLILYFLVNTASTVVQQWMNNNDIGFRDLVKGKIRN